MTRLPEPYLTVEGWWVRCESVWGDVDLLGPYPDEIAALTAHVGWMLDQCDKASLRTVAQLDRCEAVMQDPDELMVVPW